MRGASSAQTDGRRDERERGRKQMFWGSSSSSTAAAADDDGTERETSHRRGFERLCNSEWFCCYRSVYRVFHLLGLLGRVEFEFGCSTLSLPGSAWADGKLAEPAEQLGKMVEHLKSKSTQLSE